MWRVEHGLQAGVLHAVVRRSEPETRGTIARAAIFAGPTIYCRAHVEGGTARGPTGSPSDAGTLTPHGTLPTAAPGET